MDKNIDGFSSEEPFTDEELESACDELAHIIYECWKSEMLAQIENEEEQEDSL